MNRHLDIPRRPEKVMATLCVAWTTTFSALHDVLNRYNAVIVQAPVENDITPVDSPKGMPVQVAFPPAGWQRYCTERGLHHEMAEPLRRI